VSKEKLGMRGASESNQRPGQAGSGTIQKQPHAQRLGPLDGHQPHLPADMVAIHQPIRLRLVKLRILLQPRNPLFKSAAKSWTDLKAIAGCTPSDHGKLLKKETAPAKKSSFEG
jgi:hypothetical protein